MIDSREEYCRNSAEDDKDRSDIHDLRWDIYTKEKDEYTNREFLVAVPHPKG